MRKRPRRDQPPLQLMLLHTWGGRRKGAGRKPTGKAGVHHVSRSPVRRYQPVHVTARMLPISNLRGGRCYRVVRRALTEGSLRPDFQVVEFSVQTGHIHLICEAEDRRALSRGLQGLFIRIAKALNHELGRRGKVFADRYHDRVLKSPRQVRHALAYVLNNYRRHAGRSLARGWLDPCSSAGDFEGWTGRRLPVKRRTADPSLPRARTWLLRDGWRRAGPVLVDAVPGPDGVP